MTLFWILVFIVSLVFLVKGADWLLESSEKIGLSLGLSPFVVGVVIVGLGTSFPEVASAIAAVIGGVNEIPVATAIGSNIANILLIIGVAAIVGGRLAVSKSLIDLDIPLLAVSTVLFLGVAWDQVVSRGEAVLLLSLFIIYFLYTIYHKDDESAEPQPIEGDGMSLSTAPTPPPRPKVTFKDYVILAIGIVSLVGGAKYMVDAVVELSVLWQIGAGAVALVAIAFGTSLPELIVSVKAALAKKPEVALGNIFGSNVFNMLLVVGIPGIFTTLVIDKQTFNLGLPIMALATLLFVISGISRRIHIYEGAMYLVIYVFFVGKLFSLL